LPVTPAISVIIPTYNRADVLARTLAAYETQDTRSEFEVIVVDDGSTDGTPDLLQRYCPRRYDLQKIRQENAGPAAARNAALDRIRAPLVLFTGDDVIPSSSLLRTHAAAHARLGSGHAVLGRIAWDPKLPRTTVMTHIAGEGSEQFSFFYMRDGEILDERHFYTSNISLAAAYFLDGTRFSTAFPLAAFEDVELATRLADRGLRIVYCEDALGYHVHPYSVRSFVRRQRNSGRMGAALARLRPSLKGIVGFRELRFLRLFSAFGRPPLVGTSGRRVPLERAEEELQRYLEHFEWRFAPGIESLYQGTFRYFYLSGLIEEVCRPECERPLREHAFVWNVVRAFKRVKSKLLSPNLPVPPGWLVRSTRYVSYHRFRRICS
jgi:glycosyltransferase involved in cell wall biosynthesis